MSRYVDYESSVTVDIDLEDFMEDFADYINTNEKAKSRFIEMLNEDNSIESPSKHTFGEVIEIIENFKKEHYGDYHFLLRPALEEVIRDKVSI